MENGRISASQMALMMYPVVTGTGIIFIPSLTANAAGNDMWLSPVWAASAGWIAIFTALHLHRLNPNQTIIQYSERLLGKFLGKVVSLVLLFFYLVMNGGGVRIYSDFVTGSFFEETPTYIIVSSMMLLSAFAVRGGVEVIGRTAEMLTPIYILFLLLVFLLILPDLRPENALPMLENGFTPSLKGAYTPQSWFAEFFVIAFLIPYVKKEKTAARWGVISLIAVTLTFTATNLAVLFLLGEDVTAKLNYPLLDAIQYISIAEFLQHLESIVMAIWVAGAFVKFTVIQYAIVLGTAQVFELTDYKALVFPLSFLTVLFSFWGIVGEADSTYHSSTVFPLTSLIMQTLLPLGLLLISYFQKKTGLFPR
ncbi:GerAB/ArcD/ProY family transporter [Bacillus piscicola]|uniref:GerAB/ArcD/ProY family transporter n=1 Tax=Bacillus piscicola TaxID=1632684 RepID=UPI001F0895C7|nr:endospore germination permease [Bacillus piscicola]